MSRVYYNEFNRQKAAWLRHLIEEGEVAYGIVDERSITEVRPDDLRGFVQCHFFAGIGLWSLCLRRAGWADDRPVWTGSCPCGPFSAAGLRKGFDDPRHLWPEWFRLICERRPDVLFGEQSSDADIWLDLVSADLERVGYAFGAADIPAAGFGGAHRRQRFGFVADTDNAQWWADRAPWNDGQWPQTGRVQDPGHTAGRRAPGGVGDTHDQRGHGVEAGGWQAGRGKPSNAGLAGGLEDAARIGCEGRLDPGQQLEPRLRGLLHAGSSETCDWLPFTDGKWRPVESGTFPLAYEDPARLGRLRGYGDAIDVEAFTNLIGGLSRLRACGTVGSMRSLPEWIGKTDDSTPPRTVKMRVFLAHGGVCHISGRKITPADKWDLDHVKALCNGGENRESNLAPALRDKHREKTAEDVKVKAKVARIRAKHLGIWPRGQKIKSRGFEKRGARSQPDRTEPGDELRTARHPTNRG